MATAFYGGSFFGGEFFSTTTVVVAAPTLAPAGRASSGPKRRWVIGNRTFYGTADEAAEIAGPDDVPEPAPKKKQKPKPKLRLVVDEPLKPIVALEFAPATPLQLGLMDASMSHTAYMQAMGEQMAALRRAMLDDDDEDVLTLLWH